MCQWFDARRRHRIGPFEFRVPDELLRLPRISFIFKTVVGPSNDSAEHMALVVILLARAKSGSDGDFVLRPQLRLEPLKLGSRP